MTTFPLPTLAAQVDGNGITAPSFADILASLKATYQSIYGADAYLEPDSQDGQLLAVFAGAVHDANQMAIAVYNSFSPTFAQGAGLSALVKINGLARLIPSNSSVVLTLVGQAGTVINNGMVGDGAASGSRWLLPALVVIPVGGSIAVTATCEDTGAIAAAPGTITRILTPTRGWQTVTNPASAALGAPVESDATLRKRQTVSTALPSQSILTGIIGAVANLDGVTRYAAVENDTSATDANGIPAHSVSVIAEGGDVQDIARAIALKKTPGTGTFGTTTEIVIDPKGVPETINFFVLTSVPLTVEISITALPGYVSTTADVIKQAVVDFLNGLEIGRDSYLSKITSVANLLDDPTLGDTFNLTLVRQRRDLVALAAADVVIAFNEAVTCIVGDITLIVT